MKSISYYFFCLYIVLNLNIYSSALQNILLLNESNNNDIAISKGKTSKTPSILPTISPSKTISPTVSPSKKPYTKRPSKTPSKTPSNSPTIFLTQNPTYKPFKSIKPSSDSP
jgi:hypothetical protein